MTAKELKASILQLAVTGKLVPQDPNDEPASVLLERIKTEKAKLVKAGKIKKDKNPSEIVTGSDGAVYEKFKDGTVKDISDDIPFEIPEGWAWVRWKDISLSVQYGYNAPARQTGRIKMVRITDIQDNRIVWDSVPYCQIEEASIDKYLLAAGDILFARTGGTVGKSHLVTSIPEAAVYAGYLVRTRCSDSILPQYAKVFLESDFYWQQLRAGIVATAQPNFNGEKLSSMLLSLPPIAEQKRIVAKIEKLMPLVEEYGKMEETRIQLDADLPITLEKSILQEAILGKLVPQDPNDEPASELLKRIAAERKALVKAGKLKRDKGESIIFRGSDRLAYETRDGETVCIQDEIPFEIPDSWDWVRLGSVSTIVRGSGIKRSETAGSGFPCVRYGEIYTTYGYSFLKTKSFTSEGVAAKCNKANCGDVLCTLTGECKEEIAKATAYLGEEPIAIGGDLALISNHPYDPMLLVYFMFSPFLLSQKSDKSNGDIIVHIGKEAIENLLIPLPPAAEQKRIAAKVTNLLAAI